MTQRIPVLKKVPGAYEAYRSFNEHIEKAAANAGVDGLLVELVKYRASQINGCAYCLDMHSAAALKLGEDPRRLLVLDAWRDTDLFTEQERAALALTEAITRLSETRDVPDDVYERATAVFTEDQYSAIVWLIMAINGWNRLDRAQPHAPAAARAVTADRLRALHVPGTPLLLPNAWDAASAKLVEAAGFPVVATSSAAVAESLGYPDHEGAPADEMFAAAARIARAVGVPVTVDAEAGYGLTAGRAGRPAAPTRAWSAATSRTPTTPPAGSSTPCARRERIAALRAADPDLVINARVDVFLHATDQRAVLEDGIRRARAYLAAGADCVYPILIRETEVLAGFVDAVRPAAVNALYLPAGPDLESLAGLGVARISLGTGLWRVARSFVEKSLRRLASGVAPY